MLRLSIVVMCFLAWPAWGAEPALAIRNAVVETLAKDGRVEKGTVVIRGGKIESVGKNIAIPDDARIIDAAGGTLMPGIIDPYFEVAVAGPTADAGTRTVVFGGRTITLPAAGGNRAITFTRIADNFYPYDAGFKPLPRVGLTRLNLITSGSGQSAVIRVTPSDPEHMMDRPDGIAFVSLTNQTDSLDQVRSRLEAAARSKSGSSSSGGGFAARFGGGPAAGAQLWADVHDGKAPLIASVANSAAVLHILKIIEPYKNVKLTLFGAGPIFAETIDLLKGKNVRVLLRPNIEMVPNSRDRFAAARILNEAGIEVAFTLTGKPPAGGGGGLFDGGVPSGGGDDNPAAQDFPLFPVAFMVRAGLPRQAALEALTKRPAMALGLEASYGTIEPKKTADLLLYTGDPLDPASRLRMTIIDGRTTHAME